MRGHFGGDCENLQEHNAQCGSPRLYFLAGALPRKFYLKRYHTAGQIMPQLLAATTLLLIMLGYFGEKEESETTTIMVGPNYPQQ